MKRASRPRLTSSTDPVLVGRLGRPHGLAGHVTLVLETDYEQRFAPGAIVFTSSGATLTVRDVRKAGAGMAVAFVEFPDRTSAEELRGTLLFVESSDRRPLQEGEFWPEDLVGLEVRDHVGVVRGRVEAVDDESPQTRLLISTPNGLRAVPLVPDLVPEVSLSDGFLVVADLPGLLNEEP